MFQAKIEEKYNEELKGDNREANDLHLSERMLSGSTILSFVTGVHCQTFMFMTLAEGIRLVAQLAIQML